MRIKQVQLGTWIAISAILALAFLLRLNGLFRGLLYDYSFHPDVPKQITALGNFLQGHYVWYVGSLFYDGYPLGLNHLDEYLMRGLLAIRQAVSTLISPEAQPLILPEKIELYYWTHCLRVFYSFCCLGLLYHLIYSLWQNRRTTLAALLLAAISPLAIVVAHSATGDIGVDLFTLATLVCLSLYVHKSHKIWLFWAGVATGLAFSCKYQGALTAIAIGLVILLEWASNRRTWKAVMGLCIAFTGGFLGVLAGTPAMFINWGRTWKYLWANLEFIRNYDVTPEFLAQPAGVKILQCLTTNTPLIISALGWILSLLALMGLCLSFRRFRQVLRTKDKTPADLSQSILLLSFLAFPFLALFISIIGKPEVQPFHFSYLQPVIIFGAAYTLHTLWHHSARLMRGLAAFLFIAALAESAYVTEREAFFWGKADNLHWAEHMPDTLFKPSYFPTNTLGVVKTIHLEPNGIAAFRNKALTVMAHDADFWNRLHIAPIPNVPLSMDVDWLFPNGPVFPRNDRYFRVSRDVKASRQVILYSTPGTMKFGLRSGSLPVQFTLAYGGECRMITMPPHSQETITLRPANWRHSAGKPTIPDGCFLVPLEVMACGGNAWVTLLADEREERVFNFYGGLIQESGHITSQDTPTLEQCEVLENLRYLDGTEYADLPSRNKQGFRFPQGGLALPCGPYVLESIIECQTPTAEIALKLDDAFRCNELTPWTTNLQLVTGYHVVTSRFSKAFAPCEVQFELKALSGRCRIEKWSLRPDIAQIRQDLQNYALGGTRPTWLSTGRAPRTTARSWDKASVIFGDRIRLSRLSLPATLSRRDPVYIDCEMAFEKFGLTHLEDYVFFIHLWDAQGHTVHSFNFPLWQTFALGSLDIPFRFEPLAHLAPGEYTLELGINNARIEKRLPIESKGLSKKERLKRHYVLGRLTLTD